LNTTLHGHIQWKQPPSSALNTASTTPAASQSNFFKQRAVSQLKSAVSAVSATDRVYLRAEDIQRNMSQMEQKIKELGGGGSNLNRKSNSVL